MYKQVFQEEAMVKYIGKKTLMIIPVMLIVSIATFGFTSMATGDPAQIILSASGIKVTDEAIALKRAELGLDRPLYVQYTDWLNDIVHFNLGTSYVTGQPIIKALALRFFNSLKLAALGLLFLVMLALPLGILSAVYKGRWIDKFCKALSFISAAFPAFCIGLLLIYIFGVKLKVISVIETEHGWGIVLPAFTIAFAHLGVYLQLIYSGMDDVLNKDYIKAAKAKGLKTRIVIFRHALKNAMLPLVTKFGLTVGGFIGGSTVLEIVFSYRGLGTYIMDAINTKDYPVIQAYVILMALLLALINLIVDVIYVAVDPRIELS